MALLTFDRRTFLKASAASMVAAGSGARLAHAAEKPIIGIVYVGPRDDFGWNQAHAVAAKALKSHSRRHRGRGRECSRDRRLRQDHGIDDQSRRRQHHSRHVVRLL